MNTRVGFAFVLNGGEVGITRNKSCNINVLSVNSRYVGAYLVFIAVYQVAQCCYVTRR
jgi:hypothetical protein